MTKPWHLIPQPVRAELLDNCARNEAFWLRERPDIADGIRGAAALLRAAEPDYPDDCPAFAVDLGAGEQHVEICDIGITDAAGRTWVTLTAPYGWREPVDCVVSALRPLTIAAADWLDAMGGGT